MSDPSFGAGPLPLPLRPRRVGLFIAAALLIGYGVWSLIGAIEQRSWFWVVPSVLELVAAAGLLMSFRWARFLVYALSTAFVLIWLASVYLAFSAGVFAHERLLMSALMLAPGLGFSLLAIACSWMVFVYFRADRRAQVQPPH